jgi:drug/metabolite transporter (DMT)-like permease
MSPRDAAVYCFLALAWGFSFLLLYKAVAAFGWAGTTSFRGIIAGVTLVALGKLMGRRFDFRSHLKGLGIVGATTVALQYVGLAIAAPRIGTATTAILISTVPLFSMLISRQWGLEAITPSRLFGLVLGMVGIALLVGFPVETVTADFLLGASCAIIGGFSSAYGSVYASHRLQGADAWEITAGSFFLGGVMVLPFLYFVPVPTVPAPIDYVWLVLLGCLISAACYVLYFGLVSTIGPTRANSVEFLVTVVAVIVGAVFLNEWLSPVQWVGAAIVLAGCAMVLGAPKRT